MGIDPADPTLEDWQRDALAEYGLLGAPEAPPAIGAPTGTGASWPPPEWGYGVAPSPDAAALLGGAAPANAPAPEAGPGDVAPPATSNDELEMAPLDVSDSALAEPPPIGAPTLATPPAETAAPGEIEFAPSDAPELTYQSPFEIPDQAQRDEALKKLSDVDLAQLEYKHELAKQNLVAADKLKASREAVEREAANAQRYQAAIDHAQKSSESLQADAKALANAPDAYMKSRSTMQTIAGYTAAILGGLVQSKTGGVNQGLAMIDKAIDRYVDAQKSSLDMRRGAVAAQFANAGQAYHASEALRLSMYDQAQNEIEAKMLQFDPQGTQALNGEKLRRDLVAKKAQLIQKYQSDRFKEGLDLYKAITDRGKAIGELGDKEAQRVQEEKKIAEQHRHNTQEEGIAWSNANTSAKSQTWTEKYQGRSLDLEAQKLTAAEGKELRELGIGKLVPTVEKDDTGAIKTDALGQPVLALGGSLKNADGKDFKAPDAESARVLRQKMTAASEINDIIDEVLAIRDKVGGESSLVNSPEYQKLKAAEHRLTVLAKEGTQGMSSDEDMKHLAGALGADDITSFRARAAGLEAGRDRTTQALNKALQSNRYTGKPIDFPNRWVAPPETTKENKAYEELKNSTTGTVTNKIPGALVAMPGAGQLAVEAERAINFFRSDNPDAPLSSDQKRALDGFESQLKGTDPSARNRAIDVLANLVGTTEEAGSSSAAVKKYAQNIIDRDTQRTTAASRSGQ